MASLFANNAETRAQIEQRPAGHMSTTGDWIPDDEGDICNRCFKQIKMGIFVGLICSLILTLTAIEHVLTFHSLIQSSFLSLSSFVVVIFIVVIFFLSSSLFSFSSSSSSSFIVYWIIPKSTRPSLDLRSPSAEWITIVSG